MQMFCFKTGLNRLSLMVIIIKPESRVGRNICMSSDKLPAIKILPSKLYKAGTILTTLQTMMNTKLCKETFWPSHVKDDHIDTKQKLSKGEYNNKQTTTRIANY